MGRKEEEPRGWEAWVRVQRDLATVLGRPGDTQEMLAHCLDVAMRGAGLERGAIYLVDEEAGEVRLAVDRGLGEAFLEWAPDSPLGELMRAGEAVYRVCTGLAEAEEGPLAAEGLGALAMVPLRYGGRQLGCLLLASDEQVQVPEPVRVGLETVALQVGQAVALGRAQAARRESEHRHRTLFDGVGDAMFVLDAEGAILDANAEASRRLGYTREELLARSLPDLLTEEFAALAPARLEALKRHRHATFETAHVTKDGRVIPTEVSATYLEHGGRQTILSLARDVTERRRREEELNQLRRMEAIGQLAGSIAHDFNNMLCPILGYSDLIVLSGKSADRFRPEALAIREAAEQAAAMTRQLLVFSRRQVTRRKVLDLNEQVAGLEGLLRRLLGEEIELVLNLAPEPAIVRADATQVQQVALNLAINARDAMPHGGRLLLSTSLAQVGATGAADPAEAPSGSYVVLAVEDTGCGMPPEVQREIFVPLFTTKEPDRGTGLGLSTVYGIVQEHGGFVRVASRAGQGSTFRVYFPEVVESLPPPTPAPLEDLQARGREVVLVAEDQELVRNLAVGLLTKNGYGVLEAASGAEALRVAQAHEGPLHLLLTDVVMPAMSGPALFEALTPTRPDLRVLFMSGYLENVLSGDPDAWPTPRFLAKPFSARALLQGVREVLDGAPVALRGEARAGR